MWTRSALKTRAKGAFFRNVWVVVGICFLLAFIGAEYTDSVELIHRNDKSVSNYDLVQQQIQRGAEGAVSIMKEGRLGTMVGAVFFSTDSQGDWVGETVFNVFTAGHGWLVRAMSGGLFALAGAVSLLFTLLVVQPAMVGARHFFLHNRLERASFLEVTALLHRGSYGHTVVVMFLRWLFTTLWTFLLVIPGIIKGYEYKMVPFLLADNPTLDRRRVFELSREMMYGEKWNAFVLDLSFLLWNALSALTLGLGGIFFVNPYKACTEAELYAALKEKVLYLGVTDWDELPMPI